MKMKRQILLSIFSVVILSNISGQGYYRHYGVDSLNKLSTEQLYDLKSKTTGKVVAYSAGTAAGVVLIVLTINLVKQAEEEYDPESTGSGFVAGLTYFGAFLCASGFLIAPLCLVGSIVQIGRLSDINKLLENSEIKVGFLNTQTPDFNGSFESRTVPGVTVTFHF